jgi:hypothetical protein
MKVKLTVSAGLAVAILLAGGLISVKAGEPDAQALVIIAVPSETEMARLEAIGVPVFARLKSGDQAVLLVGATPADIEAIKARDLDFSLLDSDIRGKRYYLAYPMPGCLHSDWSLYGHILYEDDIKVLLRTSAEAAERLAETGVELRAITTDPKPLGPFTTKSRMPTSIQPDSLIQLLIDQVDSGAVYSYTGDLSGEWPVLVGGEWDTIVTRHTGSGESIQKATQYVGEHLEDLGLNVEYHQWGEPTYPNVIGELPGLVSPDSIVIICGHLDDMPSGPVAPGADDNASGSVAVLVAADILTQYDWAYTLRFALWTGEEQGLLGSHAYANRSYNWGENIIAVLNLDMIAYNTIGSNPDIELHAESTIPPTLDLAQLFADVVDAYGLDLIPEINPNGIGASDHASFWSYGYTAILGIEDFSDFNPRYHTTDDRLQYLDMGYFVEFVRACVGTFAHMNGGPLFDSGVPYADRDRHDKSIGVAAAMLRPAYPNPSRSPTLIRYDIAKACEIKIMVYDVQGALMKTLHQGYQEPGNYEMIWSGENLWGERTSPGVYFCCLKPSTGSMQTHKLVLLK